MNQNESNHQEHTPKLQGAFDSLSVERETLPQSSQMLSAWTDDHLTQHQREWIRNEHEFLRGSCPLLRGNLKAGIHLFKPKLFVRQLSLPRH